MATRSSPSPSPPPSAPTQATPGPRATALHKIYSSALKATLQTNSYANFSSCFPTPAKYCPTALEGVWRQLNTRLEEECLRDFERICEERRVVEGLNEWDGCIEEARTRRDRSVAGEQPPRALHTLSADELYSAYLTPYLVHAENELQDKLNTTQNANQETMEKIRQQRDEIDKLVGGLELIIHDVEESAHVLSKKLVGENGLKQETWEMEKEVVTTG